MRHKGQHGGVQDVSSSAAVVQSVAVQSDPAHTLMIAVFAPRQVFACTLCEEALLQRLHYHVAAGDSCAHTIGVQEGVLALYRGWLPSVIGVIPYVGLNFAVYETLKDMAIKQYGCETERDLSSMYRLYAGGVAGTVGQTIAYPFDVVRRRLQARSPDTLAPSGKHSLQSRALMTVASVQCISTTVRGISAPQLRKLMSTWPPTSRCQAGTAQSRYTQTTATQYATRA